MAVFGYPYLGLVLVTTLVDSTTAGNQLKTIRNDSCSKKSKEIFIKKLCQYKIKIPNLLITHIVLSYC